MAIATTSFEQEIKTDSLPAYIKNPGIPAFTILATDSSNFAKQNLPANRPVVIIYFSPDCGHCQFEAKQIVQHINDFKNTFFVWVSFHPLEQIKEFGKIYGLDKLDNMKLGRDLKYYLPSFYKVTQTPFMAIYNAKGVFAKEFRAGATADELKAELK